ncbi:MAG: hypothetical protein WCO56_14760 [Verrucomicrobiota bacterium]
MKFVLLIWLCAGLTAEAALAMPMRPVRPLKLHPQNPHYFQYRGKPVLLITAGEHYGAVLNPDFNYVKYLDTLAANGLNLTRVFTGAYVEPEGAFNIASNTLAPATNRFLCPWARSDTPGYANGGNKFDLNQWDAEYFNRLRDFVTEAARRDIFVEINLFCPFYDEAQWALSPLNVRNNVNNVGTVGRTNVYTLDQHGELLPVQEAMVRRLVGELANFENIYYELCNEPYFGGVTMAWQQHMADLIVAEEKSLRGQHLISQNIANGQALITNAHPAVSIFNFHYASPPEAVAMNYALNKVIGNNETGFKGTNDATYRREGWEFILAGGGLFNHLDYSFAVGREDGTFEYPAKQPGGGSPALRQQLGILKKFIEGMDFIRMKPDQAVIKTKLPVGKRVQVLSEPGRAYAIYLNGGGLADLTFELPPGAYEVESLNPISGKLTVEGSLEIAGSSMRLFLPYYEQDLAIRLRRVR